MNQKKIKFPLDDFNKLIMNISGFEINEWESFWERKNWILSLVSEFYGSNFNDDWLWGVVLPILSDIYYLKRNTSSKIVIGLSALPGTGKTTLGLLIEKLSLKMNIDISVVSMDDFYLPFSEMQIAIKENPWNVSRGFPGTHSINLLEEKILEWKDTGKFNHPVFDKSLKNGLGDRSHWKTSFPEIIILEGWFLGVKPLSSQNRLKENIKPALLADEISYRSKIQENLKYYLNIWQLIDKIWQIKPKQFLYLNKWKSNQEREMLRVRGSALIDSQLSDFLRMLNRSIPQVSFNEIAANYKIILDENRNLTWVGLNNI